MSRSESRVRNAVRNRRGAYFFVLDAFIAGIIITSTLAVFFSVLTTQEQPSQKYILSQDFMGFLETTTLRRYGGNTVYNFSRDGIITDDSRSLLEQVVFFYSISEKNPSITSALTNLSLILEEVSVLAPENNGLAYYIIDSDLLGGEFLLYNTTSQVKLDDSRTRLAAQRVVTVRSTNQIKPYVVEVRLWQ